MADEETAEETIARLRRALIKIKRHTHMSSIWGGLETEPKFNAMPPFRVKWIDELCKKVLEGEG